LLHNDIKSHGINRIKHESMTKRLESMFLSSDLRQINFLDPATYLCDDNLCYSFKDKKVLHSDDNHLSKTGVTLLEPMLKGVFNDSYK
jgi:hypothetical protein